MNRDAGVESDQRSEEAPGEVVPEDDAEGESRTDAATTPGVPGQEGQGGSQEGQATGEPGNAG
jgi:hypothetical protein